jgi:hypothetical protein
MRYIYLKIRPSSPCQALRLGRGLPLHLFWISVGPRSQSGWLSLSQVSPVPPGDLSAALMTASCALPTPASADHSHLSMAPSFRSSPSLPTPPGSTAQSWFPGLFGALSLPQEEVWLYGCARGSALSDLSSSSALDSLMPGNYGPVTQILQTFFTW